MKTLLTLILISAGFNMQSNYQYDNGKVTGGSTKLKIGKMKDH